MIRKRLATKTLGRGLIAAAFASAIGITINVATDLKSSFVAWIIVVVLTVASGLVGLGFDPKPAQTGRRWSDQHSKWRQSSHVQGVVLHVEVEIRPDGTRIERRDYFDLDLARGHVDGK